MRPRSFLPAAALALVVLATSAAPAARAADPDRVPELFESSFANEAKGDYDRSLNDVLEILRLDPGHYVANLRAGWLYYLKGKYGDAIVRYQEAGKLAPKAIEPELGAMLPLMAALRWTEAEAVAKRVLKRAPRDYLASSRLAFIWFSLGRYTEAEGQYREVLADYPSDTEMMLGLGWTHLKVGRTAEARQMFQRVLQIRRKNVNAQAGLDAVK